MLRKDAKIEWLAKVPLFERCSRRELDAIARLVHEVELPEGHTLIREGAEAFSFFVLLEGTPTCGGVAARSRRSARVTSSASWR